MAGSTALNLAVNVGPGTYGPMNWSGGKLALLAVSTAWGAGNVQFQMLYGTTWVNIGTAVTANAAPQVLELPPCGLRAVVTTATGVNASAVSIPTITIR